MQQRRLDVAAVRALFALDNANQVQHTATTSIESFPRNQNFSAVGLKYCQIALIIYRRSV